MGTLVTISIMSASDTAERSMAHAFASIAEVVALLGSSPLARQADAIELLERLLPDAGLSPARYRAVLREYPDAVSASLRALHDAVKGVRTD